MWKRAKTCFSKSFLSTGAWPWTWLTQPCSPGCVATVFELREVSPRNCMGGCGGTALLARGSASRPNPSWQSLPRMTVRSFLTGVHTLKTNKPGAAEAQDGELALYESGPSELSRGGALEMAELRSRPRRAARPGLLSFHFSEFTAVSKDESLLPGFAQKAGRLSALPCVVVPVSVLFLPRGVSLLRRRISCPSRFSTVASLSPSCTNRAACEIIFPLPSVRLLSSVTFGFYRLRCRISF